MHNFRKLTIWTEAMDIVEEVYRLTEELPRDEKFNLTSQIRRSAVSIPSNIAEGAGRHSAKEFNQFLSVATGSSYELETQLLIAGRLKLVEERTIEPLIGRILRLQKMIYKFKQTL